MKEAPTRRYTYYLTPQGFADKSRLTVEYLRYSFAFFRQAHGECANVIKRHRRAIGRPGWRTKSRSGQEARVGEWKCKFG